MLIDTELKTWGNSYGIRVTKEEARKLQLEKGDKVNIKLKKKKIDGFGMWKDAPSFKRDHDDRF